MRSAQVAQPLDEGCNSAAESEDDHGNPSSRGFDLLRQPVSADKPGDKDRRNPDPRGRCQLRPRTLVEYGFEDDRRGGPDDEERLQGRRECPLIPLRQHGVGADGRAARSRSGRHRAGEKTCGEFRAEVRGHRLAGPPDDHGADEGGDDEHADEYLQWWRRKRRGEEGSGDRADHGPQRQLPEGSPFGLSPGADEDGAAGDDAADVDEHHTGERVKQKHEEWAADQAESHSGHPLRNCAQKHRE